MLSAMKRAERGDGLILRLTETGGIGCTVTVDLPHFEVERAFRTNLVEADEVPIAAGRHGVSLPVEAFGIVTARLHIR